MDERRKFILTIIAGICGLFFLSTHLYLPIAKNNTKRSAQYRQLREQLHTVEQFNEIELNTLERKLDKTISNLQKKFPTKGKSKLMQYLAQSPPDANIVFTQITQKQSEMTEEYQVLRVDINMIASFFDLIKYLAQIEESPLLICINDLILSKLRPETGVLDIKIAFLSFRLIHKFPSISKYLKERYKPLDRQNFKRLIEPIKLVSSRDIVWELEDYNPFISNFAQEDAKEIAFPAQTKLRFNQLTLRGIMRIKGERVALINNTIIREKDKIAEMEVLEIQDDIVILMQSGKRYILRIGVEDDFIQP
jgi:Tfp pilus assembly protein PilO